MKTFTAYVDGASRGNPGHAGIGVAIYDDAGISIKSISKYIGKTTNNVAEYTAFVTAIEESVKLGADVLKIYLDSELVYKQYIGLYRTKDENLKMLLTRARQSGKLLKDLIVHHIPREKNKEADKLSNIAVNIGETEGG